MNETRSLINKSLTQKERHGLLAMAALNKTTPRKGFVRSWSALGLDFTYTHRSSSNLLGRFGGGWQWCVGINVGGSTVILNLLVSYLRITRRKKATNS